MAFGCAPNVRCGQKQMIRGSAIGMSDIYAAERGQLLFAVRFGCGVLYMLAQRAVMIV